ncbi:MAG: hypothetical protein ACRCYU_02905 [Nocardioides sp.]
MNTTNAQPDPPTKEEIPMTYWPASPDDHDHHPTPTNTGDGLHDQAETVYDAIRAMCHHTTGRPVTPAPVLYRILGELHAAPFAQLLRQLGNALTASAEHYQLTEVDPGRSPSTSICLAVGHLAAATHTATELSRHLAAAQAAIAGQGHHGTHTMEGELS